MNKQVTVAALLSVAAASGITAGTVIHNVAAVPTSTAPTSRAIPTTTVPTTTPRPATTSVPTTTSTTSTTPRPSPSTSTPRPVLGADVTTANLLVPADLKPAGVSGLTIIQTTAALPQSMYDSCLANGRAPSKLALSGTPVTRFAESEAGAMSSQELLGFTSKAGADALIALARSWHECARALLGDPHYPESTGLLRRVSVLGASEAFWWQASYKGEVDDKVSEHLRIKIVVRAGNRVNIVTVAGPSALLKDAVGIKSLMAAMVRRMSS